MKGLLYEDPIEVIEAMGFDPAFGLRQWFDGYHVEDVRALARGVFYMQQCDVVWDQSTVYGDPFGDALVDWAIELMIDPSSSCVKRSVYPSFYTWRPPHDFVLGSVQMFFESYLDHPFERLRCEVGYALEYNGERASLKTRKGKLELTSVPERYVFLDAAMLKGEVMRRLFEAIEVASSNRLCGYHANYRDLYARAVSFVDALWGTPPAA